MKIKANVSRKGVIVQTNVVHSKIQIQMICEISVLFRKLNSYVNSIDRSHMTSQ